jgi:uncharacterized protein (TIGR00299 family) protein
MSQSLQRIHLDPIGGIAGDMFVAAVIDTFPGLRAGLLEQLSRLPLPPGTSVELNEHSDSVLRGLRFDVGAPGTMTENADHDHAHDHRAEGQHAHDDHVNHHDDHVAYRHIQELLRKAALHDSVREHALALFASLAEAEGQVHGIDPADVEFHELGAWDSIVDFVAAAYLIAALGPVRWTYAAVPIGRGRVKTRHGVLPIPAPATTLLMRGLQVIDDGIEGERVTPTGAAILKYVVGSSARPPAVTGIIGATGNGFGSKTFPGFSNVLRCLAFTEPPANVVADEHVSMIAFEVDDQTAEDLAIALDKIRKTPGVLDVFQSAVFGKKGRMMVQVTALVRPERVEAVAELCFSETSTLGLRLCETTRKIVRRETISVPDPAVRVKVARRPDGQISAKAEMDDLAPLAGGKTARDEVRRQVEAKALARELDE